MYVANLTVYPSHAVQECIHDGELLKLTNDQSVPIIATVCTIDSLDRDINLNLQRVRVLCDNAVSWLQFEKT